MLILITKINNGDKWYGRIKEIVLLWYFDFKYIDFIII